MGILTLTDGGDDGTSQKKWINEYQESIQKNIGETLTGFLTNDEINIINQHVPNPEMRGIIREIIDELGKSICNGENPNSKLFKNVYQQVLYKNKKMDGVYRTLTKKVLYRLPDRKNIAHLFDYDMPNNFNTRVPEFRKARGAKLQENPHNTKKQETPEAPREQPTKHINPGNTAEEPKTTPKPSITPTEKTPTKQKKVKAQYETIKEENYVNKFPNFKRTENMETNVPLLSPEDIAFSYDAGRGWNCLTKNTKVPTFDIRQKIDKFIEKHGERKNGLGFIDGESVTGRTFCFYNEIDDISHIISFHSDRGISGAINIAIKGKISQQDATKLLQDLGNKNILKINPLTGKPIINSDGPNIQKAVMDFFNNK